MASKKTRFDVFKRDEFKCQYCGRTPPEVVLELDHVNPKSKGGINDINNYVTACFDCNRGKSDIKLDDIPTSLIDNLERIKEKEVQIKEYNKYLNELYTQQEQSMDLINGAFNKYFPKYSLSQIFRNGTLRNFLHYLPKVKIIEAMENACGKMSSLTSNESFAADKSIKYFCGICWNWIKYPETRNW